MFEAVKTCLLAAVALAFCQNVLSFPRLSSIAQNFTLDLGSSDTYSNGTFKRDIDNQLGLFYAPDDESDVESQRIVGGKYAKEGQFPFMAVVHRLVGEGMIAQCGGTIISKRWVLTAGHCIASQPRKFFVVFGVVDKAGIGYDSYDGPGVSMISTSGALHPKYKTSVNDIGLLYMPDDIPFNSNIQPIRLAGGFLVGESLTEREAYVIGWGRDSETNVGTQGLKYATLPIISNAECNEYWQITDHNVCTASEVGEDACQGDSGGPLTIIENGVYVQVGIVSYGDTDCPSSRPGVFTRVTGYLDWIQRATGLSY